VHFGMLTGPIAAARYELLAEATPHEYAMSNKKGRVSAIRDCDAKAGFFWTKTSVQAASKSTGDKIVSTRTAILPCFPL